jgi:hypothetical protein
MPQLTDPEPTSADLPEPTITELRVRVRLLERNLRFIEEHTGRNYPVPLQTLAKADGDAPFLLNLIRGAEIDIQEILREVAEYKRRCKQCPVMLWFVRSRKSGAILPLCHDGTSHFANCRAAGQFRRPK